ncbi:MAG: hypothetical protein GX892_08865 [Thermoanaerobacteraceae bacterium]|nr:hypothetical protein [Thermoanaerobacteraceae bacterium]
MKSSKELKQAQDIPVKNGQSTSASYVNILLYPLPIRIFHLVLVISLSLSIISGLMISFTYTLVPMKTIRFVHISSGFVAFGIVLYRLGYAFVSGDYENFSIKLKDFKTLPELAKYYLFLRETPPPLRTKYNLGQKITMLSWLIGIFYQTIAGIMLLNPSFVSKSSVLSLLSRLILPQHIRTTKYFLSIYFVMTIMLHIYLAHTEDIAKSQSMLTGWVRVKTKK